MYYIGKCSCGMPLAKSVDHRSELDAEVCPRARIQDGDHQINWRAQRSDALRPPANLNIEASIAFTRPKRAATESRKRGRGLDDDERGEDDDDVEPMVIGDDDEEYLPAPEFNPAMRYSDGGSFAMMRIPTVTTSLKSCPWTAITARAGRGNTNAQFAGLSAHDHGRATHPAHVGQPSTTGYDFEWCHLIADCLGGPTTAKNLFCGTFHANTAMLCIEHQLVGKSHLEVRVEVDVRNGTYVGEIIRYRIRAIGGADEFVETIDALATGCTLVQALELRQRLRDWLRLHRRAKRGKRGR